MRTPRFFLITALAILLSALAGGFFGGTAQATQDLGQLRQSLFMGTTLRGMLLNAYAFATLGTIAMWAAIASFIGAAVMGALGILGLRHAHKVEGVDAPAIEKIPATV